jgi:hypothetical protein
VIASHTLSLPRRKVEADKLSFFRFGALADGVIVTTDHGRWHHLPAPVFSSLLAGEIEPGHDAYDALAAKGFLRDQTALDDVAAAVRARKRFVGAGPQLHVLHLGAEGGKLGVETAKAILDHVMLSTSSQLELRLIAGPAGHDADLLAFLLQYTTEKNRYEGKSLTWRYLVDVGALPEKADAWLVDKKFVVQARFDGPGHDAQRSASGASDLATVKAAIERLHAAGASRSRTEWRVAADVTIGTGNVGDPAGVAAALAEAGIRSVRLCPVGSGEHAITAEAFKAFYRGFLDAALALQAAGTPLVDVRTATLATRALQTDAGVDVEMRSPTAALNTLVFDHEGNIFPSESGAALFAQGDEMFLLGKAGVISYKDCAAHPTLRTLAVASMLESLPGFADHWSTPWSGVDPTEAYATTGDLFARPNGSAAIAFQAAHVEAFFERLVLADEATLAIFSKWGG